MRTNNFFITGLPRSRTAWLANFLTYRESFCYHEAIRDVNSLDDLKKLLSNPKYKYMGSSDSSLPLFAEKVMNMFPDSKLVVVERDIVKVKKSLNKLFSEHDEIHNMLKMNMNALGKLKSKYSHLLIQYESLDDVNVCKELWEYCLPDIEFNYERWRMLDLFKIDMHKTKYMAHINDCKWFFNEILGMQRKWG